METGTVEESQSLMLDGNALAGLLHELFYTEMTVAPVQCVNCGRHGEMGSLWAFIESPDYVLRCPGCQNIILRIALTLEQVYVDARGATYLCIPKRV